MLRLVFKGAEHQVANKIIVIIITDNECTELKLSIITHYLVLL